MCFCHVVCMQGGMRRLNYAPGTWDYLPDEALPFIQQSWAKQGPHRNQRLPINPGAQRYAPPAVAAMQRAGQAAINAARPGALPAMFKGRDMCGSPAVAGTYASLRCVWPGGDHTGC